MAYQKKVASSFLERGAMCGRDCHPEAGAVCGGRCGTVCRGHGPVWTPQCRAVEPLCDDANPDDDMSRPADRTEEQQGSARGT